MKKLLSLLLLFSVVALSAQNFDKAKLDQYMETLGQNSKGMFSVALLKDGEPVYQKSVGFATVETGKKANKNTQYRIGSITKVFTTTMIFQLIEENKLSLDTKLSKYYPKIKNAEDITVSMLLSHRSGIHNFTNDSEYLSYMTQPKSKADMASLIEGLGSDFTPGSKADYSNSAFVLLGFIIEDITSSTYQEQLQKRIANKLNLDKTTYGGKIDASANQAMSYSYNGAAWAPSTITDMSIPHGAGAIISTPTDISKFFTGLFTGKLISENSLSKMKEIREGYGRGLFQLPFNDKTGYGHGGGIDSFSSNSGYFEAEGLALAITSNGMNYTMNDIMIVLLSAYFGRDYEVPNFDQKAITLSAEELPNYEGVFATDAMPLKITVKVANGALTAQATGQGAFPLTAFSKSEFRYDPAGIVMVFAADGDTIDYTKFKLKQGGSDITFTKE